MKKLFLMLALTGMVSAVSASTVSALSHNTIVSVIGDDKKGDDKGKKKEDKKACAAGEKTCTKGEKSCCKKDAKKVEEKVK